MVLSVVALSCRAGGHLQGSFHNVQVVFGVEMSAVFGGKQKGKSRYKFQFN